MLLFDFKCLRGNCATHFEELAESYSDLKPCPTCGTPSKTVTSPVRSSLDGTDPGFPDAYRKWAEIRYKKARQEKEKSDRD